MKKGIIAIIMIIALVMAACGSSSASSASAPEATPEVTEVPADANIFVKTFGEDYREWPLYTGDKSKLIGMAGTIMVDRKDFLSLPYETIKEINEYIGTLKDDLNYFSICFDSLYGLQYYGCIPEYPVYGKMDITDAYTITGTIGAIEDTGSYFVLLDENDEPVTDAKEPFGINGIES